MLSLRDVFMRVRDKIRAYLALGSNVGNREANLECALSKLSIKAGLFVNRVSSVYESPPAEVIEQPDYLNRVLEVETWLEPAEILDLCLSVEKEMGRVRKKAKGPRNIDIDILLYGDAIIRTDVLEIPHKGLFNRPFFLIPLKELLGDVILTGVNRRISIILTELYPYEITVFKSPYN